MTRPDIATQLMRSSSINARVTQVFRHRARHARQQYGEKLQKAVTTNLSEIAALPWLLTTSWQQYAIDWCQRSVLFWETLQRRGTQWVAHEMAGKPPVLHFDYEMVLDARKFERPANYALVRITPPSGVRVDWKRRPYVIIDPRAGHGPGIGGFKDDSQVGVALREGHPVYFVIFFPKPEPGQTMLDVCSAEQQFVAKVRELHPESAKPVVIGNCQGGWAAMMLAASSPEHTGALVINGAPMSYWGGAWSEGEGNNPMRYTGGLLGGTWLASLTADLGNGLFDGAYIVENFESLDPANTYWDKYYHLLANADTEPPRFLEFERWWGGYYLMNRSEIEWITQNLFVGNELWTGGVKTNGQAFDLRDVQAPIIMFASLGDNITPPQQAFNWVADIYGSTEEIKARGQVIVGLLHQSAGHLALFVSGKVARREHAQLVSVLKSIEALPPGLYAMRIDESKRDDGTTEYEVSFVERELEDVAARLNRFKRVDEKPFVAVAAISEFNQRAYELFAQPLVCSLANEPMAQLMRLFHPLRAQRWLVSDLNPWLWWLAPAAEAVRAQRRPLEAAHPWRKLEAAFSKIISTTFDLYRDLRDATNEAAFFAIYANLFSLYLAERAQAEPLGTLPTDPRSLPFVKAALAGLEAGGYAAALARTAELLERHGAPVPLARLDRKTTLTKEYAELLPELSPHDWKMIRAEQDIIVRFEPERAVSTLPRLLTDPRDRERFLRLIDRLAGDRKLVAEPSAEQLEMLNRLRQELLAKPPERPTPERRAVH